MAAGRQLRLLLWKDYLIRKRKLITLAGIGWATMVMMCLYVVRINVDNQDFPSCGFPARAMPSAGMLTFVQSFVCSVNNDCEPLDKFQEIPTYENSKLTQLQRRFSPLLHNETILEVAGMVPDGLQLLATLADVLDNPTMVDISKNGLQVGQLFSNPGRVRRFVAAELNVTEALAAGLMDATLALTGIFGGNIDRCDVDSISNVLQMENKTQLAEFVRRICELSEEELQKMAMSLLVKINFPKYIKMVGDMYYKLSGDARIRLLGDAAAAALRLSSLESFLPPALTVLFRGERPDFSYFDAGAITRAMDQLEIVFGWTNSFKTLRDITDTLTMGLQYLDKVFVGNSSSAEEAARLALSGLKHAGVDQVNEVLNQAVDLIEKGSKDSSLDIFKLLAQAMNMINKFLPEQTKHEVLFYSTLLAKLIEGANRVVSINLNIQEMAYDVSLRNPAGVKVLLGLPISVVRKGFEGLADAERVQIVTSKLNVRGQIFCDSNKLASFFKVSKAEANSLKSQLCTDAWKDYIADFIKSFGIYEVKDIINNMASIVVQETFGKDTSDQLYTTEKDFEVLKNFTQTLIAVKARPKILVDWNALFNVTDDSEFMKIFTDRRHLGKQILITVHGALAKEVVKQNAILDFKISPILLDLTTLVTAVREQLAATPAAATARLRDLYPRVVETMLTTLLHENKTYKALSTPSEEVVCRGADAAAEFLSLPPGDSAALVAALCDATTAIDAGLRNDSKIAKAITSLKKSSHGPLAEVDWTALIDGLKQVYLKLDTDYPYLFEFLSYGMDAAGQARVEGLMREAKDYWFDLRRIDRTLHLSIKLVFRLLDVVDREAFGMRSEGWVKVKHAFATATPPLALVDDFIKLLTALARNESYPSQLPPITAGALAAILPNVPQLLVDSVDIIVNRNIPLEAIISLTSGPHWPCGERSVADVLALSPAAARAVHAIENLACADTWLKKEWQALVKERNISFYNASTWNTTTFGPHVFLQFSGTFDALVEDTTLIKDLVQDLVNDTASEGGPLTVVDAFKYAARKFESTDKNDSLRNLFSNLDEVLNSIAPPPAPGSTSALWEQYARCGADCGALARAAWRGTLMGASVAASDVAGDLLTYFTEINDPSANVLQMLGFTKSTGLYILADRLPEFVAALLNSYWDYGFMSQVRRAALTDFWDCEAVLEALAPAPGGADAATVRRVRPYVCPSLLYWLSLPRGDNALLDVLAKPQYTFYTLSAENLTSRFEDAFDKVSRLASLLAAARNRTDPPITENDTKLSSLQEKLRETVDTVLNYKLNATDPAYRLFNEINKKQFISTAYLTRIAAIVNKLAVAFDNLKPQDINKEYTEDEAKKLASEISTISKIFKRRPHEALALHFDVITRLLTPGYDKYDLVKAFDDVCDEWNNNDNSKDILSDGVRTKNQICSKQYKVMYEAVNTDDLHYDFDEAQGSLANLVSTLNDGDGDTTDIVGFFNDRTKLTNSLKLSIKYSYDLGLPIYLKYLQSNLQHYGVVLRFLSGGDWWASLRALYAGPHATSFFDAVENSFDIAEDVLTKLDEIHLVRLLRDVNVNDTASFCQPNITLAEYVPDATGALARLKHDACSAGKEELFREVPPLVFASQGYEDSLTLSKEINYTALYSDIASVESGLAAIKEGPSVPERPGWITDERISRLRAVAADLLSKESLTKIAFGVLGNLVDAGTLFLNSSQCSACSRLTSWVKQLNLQLYKKQEYDALLCGLQAMPEARLHAALRDDFHWDMAYRELISSRNYTKFELNKALHELLGQTRLHLLEDQARSRLFDCLLPGARHNALGHAALLAQVMSLTMTLVRAELPHLVEVDGIRQAPLFQEWSSRMSPTLDAFRPLRNYLRDDSRLRSELEDFMAEEVMANILSGEINLRAVANIGEQRSKDRYMRLAPASSQWAGVCRMYDCRRVVDVIQRNVNATLVAADLPQQQDIEFWKFSNTRDLVYRLQRLLAGAGRLLALGSRGAVAAAARGALAPSVDLLMDLLSDDWLDTVRPSIRGIVNDLEPVVQDGALKSDLWALTDGLLYLHEYRDMLAKEDIQVSLGEAFTGSARLEARLGALGLNHTNFWSLAAPRLREGYLLLSPILSWKSGDHISQFACELEPMSRVLAPAGLGVVSRDDVLGATADQFCGLPDHTVKQLLLVLQQHVNYTYVIDKVSSYLLRQLYSAAKLTQEQGSAVTAGLPRLARVLPGVRADVAAVADSFAGDPLFKALANFSSVGGLLASGEFMASAGNMVCGSPFVSSLPRLYRSIVASEDHADQPDDAQLQALPTDFCRSLYKDIIGVAGGKIVWSFVKPLIMGQVLYTPADPLVDSIIQKANASFAHMAHLASLVHSFAGAFPSAQATADHREGVAVLARLVTAPAFQELRTALLGDVEVPEVDLAEMFDDFGDMSGIGSLLSKASQLLRCINLDRFHAAADEDELARRAAQLAMLDEFSAGLVFLNSAAQGAAPTHLQYKIRMDIDNAPTTSRTKNFLWIPGPEANFLENMRYFRGFVQIQDLIDQAIVQVARASTRHKRDAGEDPRWAVYAQQMPYPCYRKDFFQTSLYESQALIVGFFFSLLFSVAAAVRVVVHDKESGNTMLMHVMGVKLSLHTLSWFLWSSLEMALTCACVTLVLCAGGVLPHSEPSLVFTLVLVFGFSVLCFCYMISKLFSKASFAAVCAAIAYLITFMPFVLILSLEAVISKAAKIVICLSMSSSLCYAFLHVARREAAGAGARWAALWAADTADVSAGAAMLMMLLDAAIYVAIGWTIDRYFGLKTLQSNISYCNASDEKAGVSILNVTKVYGEGSRHPKVALDNVSMELHKGQVTTLLGHNGAGKTTLINILTGMLRPTRGHVVVRCARAGAPALGACPQRDVLHDALTPREHVALYAQLKSGKTLDEVQDEVDSMLRVLSLGGVSDEPVARLSGGTRRRLCVALAFVCEPRLVSLDEPTAGVDPQARREIWSMIEKLKEDRTILLTTHHLDEAELLSDQLVILHKGQIHTTGSPVEIKRTLGSGYRLSVTYPLAGDVSDDVADAQESSKSLLRLVRQTVRNAALVDAAGRHVDITLPFFDANGLNNNFLQLCESLEANQEALGFTDFALDCSSLEQAFYAVSHEPPPPQHINYEAEDIPSKSASTSSVRTEASPLVAGDGPLAAPPLQQFLALMLARYIHYKRNRWLSFVVLALPALFVLVAMAFSTVRPPPDNERPLPLRPRLYPAATEFLVPEPSVYSADVDPQFARLVMDHLMTDKPFKNWTAEDTPTCSCADARQVCGARAATDRPGLMLLPDATTLNQWLVNTQKDYVEKRYGGYSSALSNNITNLIAWYNNKGHHALPAFLSSLHSAILRASTGRPDANITTYSHPMKISKEQISKDTVYQHVADAGISGLVVLAYALVSAGAAVYAVSARARQEKRLQLLSGVSPALYWTAALAADMIVIVINMCVTALLMEAFHFPVFVERNNLPAICLLILLYGFSCGCLMHVLEKLFAEASVANMLLFCGNAFLGLGGLTVLLILDVISDSERTDNARWVLHKIFLLSPQFALGDGLLEIAKNTIQAQVLSRFGMDTYKDPLASSLVAAHYAYLLAVGAALFCLNLAIEYQVFDSLLSKFRGSWSPPACGAEASEVCAERARVLGHIARAREPPLRLHTIGNINAGFVDTEGVKTSSLTRLAPAAGDVAACARLGKRYPTRRGTRVALADVTLGVPPGQCTVLLGENGAGKSTTFALLTGQARADAGHVYVAGRARSPRQLCDGLISYCPQTDAVDPLLTVQETLALYCRLRGIADRDQVIRRTLDMFELAKYRDTRAGALSGGNRRKLCAAVAFMSRSLLVLLDEPTSGMDPVSRGCVSRAARRAARAGRGVLLATHALRDARHASRAALLRAGRLHAIAEPDSARARFGGGYVVECVVAGGAGGAAWRRVRARAPHAVLRVLHHAALHFLVPDIAIVDGKEVRTRLSDIFRLMAELQGAGDVDDYTLSQSSLEQMFLSSAPAPADDLTDVTAL